MTRGVPEALVRFALLGLLLHAAPLHRAGAGSAALTERQDAMGSRSERWDKGVLAFPYPAPDTSRGPLRMLIRQDYERLQINKSVIGTPLRIGSRSFRTGLGTHSHSIIRVTSPKPIVAVRGWIGIDANERTSSGAGSAVFVVASGRSEHYRSDVLRGGQDPVRLDIAVTPTRTLDFIVTDADDGPACDHADWADLTVVYADGTELQVSAMPEGAASYSGRYPFSFTVGGKHCDEVLPDWYKGREAQKEQDGRAVTVDRWSDPASGLRLTMEAVRYPDFAAIDWVLRFENVGQTDTRLIADVLPLDMTWPNESPHCLVHRAAGGTPDPKQFESTVDAVGGSGGASVPLGSGAGRSSTQHLPFFKVELANASYVVAVGWSGTWRAGVEAPARQDVHVWAGQAATRFVLRPGESVRTPRILILRNPGDTLEANAAFRQLIYKWYAARRSGNPPLPILFSNTCFTRGGGWLNECNATNQISLINAYAPLGLEAVITDAGWFEGGWPNGAGNWTPRSDAYPEGMAPVAGAAAKHKMRYGLWFEPERVVAGTQLHREHPEWCLAAGAGPQGTLLANFALKEVRDHFFAIVKGFMDLPGFRVYRQDFNMDPAPFWSHNDQPDRVGITEMKYIEGLYAFWDQLAAAWPDSIREECASGGHRIDLETVKRFHLHQKTDYWFDNEVDQASIWALSQYLPNSTFVAPISRLDDYTFRSVFPTSLCIGWIADDQDFPKSRAARMLERYRALRHLLVGAYYPLTGYSRSTRDWMAMQFHRSDLDSGMIIVYRRKDSPYRSLEVSLRGVKPSTVYALRSETTGAVTRVTGAGLRKQMVISLMEPHMSDILVYSRANP